MLGQQQCQYCCTLSELVTALQVTILLFNPFNVFSDGNDMHIKYNPFSGQ